MSHIFFIADEISDFMIDTVGNANKKIEDIMIRLAQMARAVGIHMVISTSRPCKDVLPDMVRVNIMNRIAFQMATADDSEFFLDVPSGGEKLFGKGDGLYYGLEDINPQRIQTPLITDEEITKLS